MGDVMCPKCRQRFMRTHSILKEQSEGAVEIHYEWMCLWCGHREGDYSSETIAKEDYNKKYGGIDHEGKQTTN